MAYSDATASEFAWAMNLVSAFFNCCTLRSNSSSCTLLKVTATPNSSLVTLTADTQQGQWATSLMSFSLGEIRHSFVQAYSDREVKLCQFMVKFGHLMYKEPMMPSARELKLVTYVASLDVEVLRFADLRKRVIAKSGGVPHRVDFCHLIVVTEGALTHVVDFVPIPCSVGSWLVIKPGQVHAFDLESSWDGWLVVFKPEVLPTTLSSRAVEDSEDLFSTLPTSFVPYSDEQTDLLTIISQMASSAGKCSDSSDGNLLMRAALFYLLVRVDLFIKNDANKQYAASYAASIRFMRFKKMVEERLRTQHHIQDYAANLGCSEKSLNRTVLAVTGVTAKTYLMQRIVLEAKRLLVHTTQSVGAIGVDLGFEEPTNFVKFFKREAGMLPTAFRSLYEPMRKEEVPKLY